jgi:exonuclease III
VFGSAKQKNIVKNLIKNENIDILCLQETEVDPNLDHLMPNFPGFAYESENHSLKSRVGIYINSLIKYNRCNHLEGNDSHIIIVDVKTKKEL